MKSKNSKVLKRIDLLKEGGNDFIYMKDYKHLTNEKIIEFNTSIVEKRKSLEDKAKTNIFGVTLTVSIILGLAQAFEKIPIKCLSYFGFFVLAALSLYCLISFIYAAYCSIYILGYLNIQYDISPSNSLLNSEQLKQLYAANAELNVEFNILRNNYIFTSYRLIMNALISMSIIFCFVVFITYFSSAK